MVSVQQDRRKLRKWISRIVLGAGLLILFIGGAVGVFRIPVTQYLIERVAQQAQIPQFSAQVRQISFDEFVLVKLVAGENAEFSLDSLTLKYDLLDLWSGGALDIKVDGLQLALDVTGKNPLLGSLDVLVSSGDSEEPSAFPALPFRPELHLNDSALNITAEQGAIYLPFAAEFVATSEEDIQGWLSFDGGRLGDREPEEFYLGAIFSSSDLQLDWDVNWRELGFSGAGAASFFLDHPGLSWNVYGDIAGSVPAALLGNHGAEVQSIDGVLKLDGVGDIAVSGPQPKRWREAVRPLLEGFKTATANLLVETEARVLLHSGMQFKSSLPLQIRQRGVETRLELNQDAEYVITGLDSDPSLPPELLTLLGDSVSGQILKDQTDLTFSFGEGYPYRIDLNGQASGASGFGLAYHGDLSGKVEQIGALDSGPPADLLRDVKGTLALRASKISLPEISADEVGFEVSALQSEGGGWKGSWRGDVKGGLARQKTEGGTSVLKLLKGGLEGDYQFKANQAKIEGGKGSIELSSISLPKKLKVTGPVSLQVQDLMVDLVLPSSAGQTVILTEIKARTSAKRLNLQLVGAQRGLFLTNFAAGLKGNSDEGWRLKSTLDEVLVPDLKLQFTNVVSGFVTPFPPGGVPEDVSQQPFEATVSGSVKSEDETLALPDGQFLTQGKGTLQKVKLHGEVGLLKGATLLKLDGELAPENLNGKFDVVIPKILFLEGGMQPETFSPLLSDVKVQNGTVSGHAEITLDQGTPDGHGYINLDINQALINALPVMGLEGRFFFQGLTEPLLPPGQSLKIESLDAGVPITDIDLLFGALLEDGEPVVDLRNAGLKIAGGQVSLKPDTFQVLEENQNLEILIDKLDVKELFTLIGRNDLSGTGLLSGSIPVSIVGDQVVITGGRLATEGPGVLQIRSQVVADALASGGEQVELLIKALQNFEYTELTLDLEKPLDSAAQVRLGISGANKDVLDGHPFRLNVNLETKIEPLLDVLLQGQKISQGLVSGFLKNR